MPCLPINWKAHLAARSAETQREQLHKRMSAREHDDFIVENTVWKSMIGKNRRPLLDGGSACINLIGDHLRED